jgi:hypothetical protein
MKRIPARSFQDLIVWQKAHQFVLAIYRYTRSFSKEEIYSLTSQFRRAAVSIPANIAEGFKKKTRSDKARFYEYRTGLLRGMPVLSYPRGGPWVRRQWSLDVTTRRSQQATRKLQSSDCDQ